MDGCRERLRSSTTLFLTCRSCVVLFGSFVRWRGSRRGRVKPIQLSEKDGVFTNLAKDRLFPAGFRSDLCARSSCFCMWVCPQKLVVSFCFSVKPIHSFVAGALRNCFDRSVFFSATILYWTLATCFGSGETSDQNPWTVFGFPELH